MMLARCHVSPPARAPGPWRRRGHRATPLQRPQRKQCRGAGRVRAAGRPGATPAPAAAFRRAAPRAWARTKRRRGAPASDGARRLSHSRLSTTPRCAPTCASWRTPPWRRSAHDARAQRPKNRRRASRAQRRRCKRCANPPPLTCAALASRCASSGGARAGHGAAVPGGRHGAARGQHERHQTQEQGAAWRLLLASCCSSADDGLALRRRLFGMWSGCLLALT